MEEQLILVDKLDKEIGTMEKMRTHELGKLHRAISVFLFNEKGELLVQKRASSKYHSGGLWTNTCCSHPRPNETTNDAAIRRLYEEMGICSDLFFAFSFIYKAKFDNGLTEHEFDHVFMGSSEAFPQLNPEEAEGFKYEAIPSIIIDMEKNPDQYTEWFKIAILEVDEHITKNIPA